MFPKIFPNLNCKKQFCRSETCSKLVFHILLLLLLLLLLLGKSLIVIVSYPSLMGFFNSLESLTL